MRKLERILGVGVTLALLATQACGSEDSGSDAHDDSSTSTGPGTSTGTSTGTSSTLGTTAGSSTAQTATATATTSAAVTGTSGTTGAGVTSGTTGFGVTTSSSGTGGPPTSSGSVGSATNGVGGATSTGSDSSTTGEVFCNDMLTGEDFYLRPQSCAHCHGDDALGTEDGPESRHPNADYLRWIVREGRMDHPDFPEGMPPVPEECLTDQMIEEIIVFLDSFPQPTTGAELYADYCANCHGAEGEGGVSGVGLDGELHHNADIVVTGNDTTNFASRDSYMPGQGDKLTTAEIQQITDYLQNELGLGF